MRVNHSVTKGMNQATDNGEPIKGPWFSEPAVFSIANEKHDVKTRHRIKKKEVYKSLGGTGQVLFLWSNIITYNLLGQFSNTWR